jgi:hypothetical protein
MVEDSSSVAGSIFQNFFKLDIIVGRAHAQVCGAQLLILGTFFVEK